MYIVYSYVYLYLFPEMLYFLFFRFLNLDKGFEMGYFEDDMIWNVSHYIFYING